MTDIYSPLVHRILLVDLHPYDVTGAAVVDKYISSESYITEPTDTPANEPYIGVLTNGSDLTFTREMFSGNMLRGASIPDRGSLIIANTKRSNETEAIFSDWTDPSKYTWDGRAIQAYLIVKGAAYSTKVQVLDGIIDDIEYDETTITFRLRNNAYLLEQAILQTAQYAGTGTSEGGAELTGKWKPRLFGRKADVPAVLLNAASLIYQVHHGEMQEVEAVRVRGINIDIDADYGSYALLAAASITAGDCATCLAEGLVRFHTQPDGVVTVDAKGSKLTGTYSAKAADIIEFIGEEVTGITADSTAITALNTANSSDVSFYAGLDAVMRSEALDSLSNDIGAWWGFNRAGELDCGRLDAPTSSPSLYLDEGDIENQSMTRSVVGRPIYKLSLDYRPKGYVLNESDIAGSVTAANRALYVLPFLSTDPATDSAVLTKHKSAIEYRFLSNLYDETPAETERDRLLALWKVRRDQLEMRTNLNPLQVEMGQTVNITFSGFNLDSGANCVVFGFTESYLSGNVSIKVLK